VAETYGGMARFADVDGQRVCYVDEGSGRPLLFIHGLGGTMNNWRPTIEHFRERYRVIALDLPSCGESGHSEADHGLDFFAGVIRGLLARLGVEEVTVIGHSLGGLITLHLALERPGMVEEMVLVDAAGGKRFPRAIAWAVHRLPVRWVKFGIYLMSSYLLRFPFGLRVAGVYHLNEYTRALIDYQVALADSPDFDLYLESYYRTTRTVFDACYGERLGEISCPTLIVWGQKDAAVSPGVGRLFNTRIEGSFLVSVPRAAHVPQLDQPELFNRALEVFLAGSSGRAAPQGTEVRDVGQPRAAGG